MPEKTKPARRSIPVGTYTTKGQVQGRSSNVTERFLSDVGHDKTGLQELYQHALNDIPDPINPGKTLTYGQVLEQMRTPAGLQRAEAYGRTLGMQRTMQAQEYAQAMFDAARGRLLQRGAENPGTLAFSPEAVDAFIAPRKAAMLADPNYTQPEQAGRIMDANTLRQFFAAQPVNDGTGKTAPGTNRRSITLR